jgi:hypothetical protein
MATAEGGINASLAEEQRKAGALKTSADALEAEAGRLEPQMQAAMKEVEDEYQRLLDAGHTEEEAQQKLLDKELWAQTSGLQGMKATFQTEADHRLNELNALATHLLSAKTKGENLGQYIDLKRKEFQGHLAAAEKYEASHSEEDVKNISERVDVTEFGTNELQHWLAGFRKIDGLYNKRVHEKLVSLGAEMNHTVFNELQKLYEEEKELKTRSGQMSTDFLTHLASDEASVHEKMTSLYMASDEAVKNVMARRGLSEEQKQALIREIRMLASSLSKEVANGQDALAGEHRSLEMKLNSFKRLVEFADGKFNLEQLDKYMDGIHGQSVRQIKDMMKQMDNLGEKYPWFKAGKHSFDANDAYSLAETGSESLSEADAALALSDEALERRVAELERAVST